MALEGGAVIDFTQAFSYPFRDAHWPVKLAVMGLIVMVPVLGVVVLTGWMILIARRVIGGQSEPLVGPDEPMAAFVLGLKYAVVAAIYLLPVLLLSVLFSLMAGGMQGFDESSLLLVCLSSCLGVLFLGYLFLLGFYLVAAVGSLADTGRLRDALRLRLLGRHIRQAPVAYVLCLLGGFLAFIVASLGFVFCLVGGAFTSAYAMAIQGHLYGQAYGVQRAARA